MAEPVDGVLREAAALVEELRSGRLDDAELAEVASRLDRILPDPGWFDYTVDHVPELSTVEVVRRAFSYTPIAL